MALVQQLFNKNYKKSFALNGQYDAALKAAIYELQGKFMPIPDGRIDPGGGSFKALNGQIPAAPAPTGAWSADKFGNEIFVRGASDLIVSIPTGATGALHAVVLFGGLNDAKYGASFMKSQVEAAASDFFSKVIVITSRHGNGFNAGVFNAILQQKGVSMASYSVCGFSKGGPPAIDAAGGAKALGLMDPGLRFGDEKPKGNAKMIYNPNNWKSYPAIADLLNKLGTAMGGNALNTKSVGYDHDNMPKAFLSKFKAHLL